MILMDTNFFMIPHSEGVDVISQIKDKYPEKEIVTITPVEKELKGLLHSKSKKERDSAKIGLQLIEVNNINVIEHSCGNNSVDEQILDFAKTNNCIVCTQDKELKKKLSKYNIQTLVFRQRHYVTEV